MGVVTLSELLADVYPDVNYQASPASAVVTRLTGYLNQGVRRVLGEAGMERLLDSNQPYTFASVTNQSLYTMPEAAALIRAIEDRTNQQKLRMMTLEEYRTYAPDPTRVTGTPEAWVPIGKVAVNVQPSTADVVLVKSTSASDNGTVTAYIEGIRTGGYLGTDSVAMNGTTAAQFPAFADWVEITDFYISVNAVGTVTLIQASGLVEMARISVGHKRPRYYGFALWPTPASAITYYVDYRREILDMVNGTDEPPFPTDYHWILSAYARMREYEQKRDARYVQARDDYHDGLNKLKNFVLNPPDYRPVAGKLPVRGGSNLGAWYPDGIWPGISY